MCLQKLLTGATTHFPTGETTRLLQQLKTKKHVEVGKILILLSKLLHNLSNFFIFIFLVLSFVFSGKLIINIFSFFKY